MSPPYGRNLNSPVVKAFEKDAVLDEIKDLLKKETTENVYYHLRRLRMVDLVWLETAIRKAIESERAEYHDSEVWDKEQL